MAEEMANSSGSTDAGSTDAGLLAGDIKNQQVSEKYKIYAAYLDALCITSCINPVKWERLDLPSWKEANYRNYAAPYKYL